MLYEVITEFRETVLADIVDSQILHQHISLLQKHRCETATAEFEIPNA